MVTNSFILPELGGVDPAVLADPALNTRLPHLSHREGEPYAVPIGAEKLSIEGHVRPQITAEDDGGIHFALANKHPFIVRVESVLRLIEFVDLLDVQALGLRLSDSYSTPAIGAITMRAADGGDWSVVVSPHIEGTEFTDAQLLAARGFLLGYTSRSLAKRPKAG